MNLKRFARWWFVPVVVAVLFAIIDSPVLVQGQSGPAAWTITSLLDNAVGTFGYSNLYGTLGGTTNFVPVATPTDTVCLIGATGSTVRVKRIDVSGVAGAAGTMDVSIVKRTALDTGGSPAARTVGLHDSSQVASVVTLNEFKANPTPPLGAGVVLRTRQLNLGVAGAAGLVSFDFATANDKPLLLTKATEQVCINLNGETLPTTPKFAYSIEWQESTP